VLDPSTLSGILAARWGVRDVDVAAHHGGMNSGTWLVRAGPTTWVAKAVPLEQAARFAAGLAVAAQVEAAGIAAGAPAPTLDGRPVVEVEGGVLALLPYVRGGPLSGATEGEHRRIGVTLGRVHRALDGVVIAAAERFHWIDPHATHLATRPHIQDRVGDALAAWDALPPTSLTWGLVHSDPAPEAFRYDGLRAVCGVIDWDFGLVAPRMYDVASAVMYLGGPDRSHAFLDAYLATGALDKHEAWSTLRPMLRMRWAVQADYFARRLDEDDQTGIDDAAGNGEGLADAIRGLDRHRDR
jgi:Ser/Thr protein kinase RdoA (MazF antagonist)